MGCYFLPQCCSTSWTMAVLCREGRYRNPASEISLKKLTQVPQTMWQAWQALGVNAAHGSSPKTLVCKWKCFGKMNPLFKVTLIQNLYLYHVLGKWLWFPVFVVNPNNKNAQKYKPFRQLGEDIFIKVNYQANLWHIAECMTTSYWGKAGT